ncbi:MAG TPA: tRNA-binding protein, partial [Aggregatilineales bacterium]|nr:tRNA-binding protein [Aggregatilineales bacterium]
DVASWQTRVPCHRIGSYSESANTAGVAQMATYDDFTKLDIRTGVIEHVEDFPRARNASYKVRVNFGPEVGTKWSSVQATNYGKDALIGMQVVAVVNFEPKNIAGFMSEVLVLGVPQEDGSLSLLTPSLPGRLGGKVY